MVLWGTLRMMASWIGAILHQDSSYNIRCPFKWIIWHRNMRIRIAPLNRSTLSLPPRTYPKLPRLAVSLRTFSMRFLQSLQVCYFHSFVNGVNLRQRGWSLNSKKSSHLKRDIWSSICMFPVTVFKGYSAAIGVVLNGVLASGYQGVQPIKSFFSKHLHYSHEKGHETEPTISGCSTSGAP